MTTSWGTLARWVPPAALAGIAFVLGIPGVVAGTDGGVRTAGAVLASGVGFVLVTAAGAVALRASVAVPTAITSVLVAVSLVDPGGVLPLLVGASAVLGPVVAWAAADRRGRVARGVGVAAGVVPAALAAVTVAFLGGALVGAEDFTAPGDAGATAIAVAGAVWTAGAVMLTAGMLAERLAG